MPPTTTPITRTGLLTAVDSVFLLLLPPYLHHQCLRACAQESKQTARRRLASRQTRLHFRAILRNYGASSSRTRSTVNSRPVVPSPRINSTRRYSIRFRYRKSDNVTINRARDPGNVELSESADKTESVPRFLRLSTFHGICKLIYNRIYVGARNIRGRDGNFIEKGRGISGRA